jgi:trigger factor
MQVTETSTEGLKRELTIVVPAGELEGKLTQRLDEIGRAVRVPGFRPGRVPMQILRRRFGSSVLGEVLENTVQESSAEAMRERNLRPALPPKLDLSPFQEGADLEYKLSLEILPDIPALDVAGLDVERLVVDVPDADIDKAVERLAEQHRKSEPVERAAAKGDILVADLDGRIGEEPIPGASGQDRNIELGGGYLIEGFEDQLLGAAAGEERTVNVTFPADYGAADLAGKDATFTVKIKEVRERQPAVIDDTLAEAIGLENLAELRDEVRQRMQRDWNALARQQLKRKLLDKLSDRYEFAVPPGMVEIELESIWRQHEQTQGGNAADAAPESGPAGEIAAAVAEAEAAESAPTPEAGESLGQDEAAIKETYRQIAERRVRLGLLLAEIGRSNNISVTQDELNQALRREALRHPGHEREVFEFFRNNPAAAGELRAPILEDKVIDFIVELAKLEERRLTPQELLAEQGAMEAEAPPAEPAEQPAAASGEGQS